MGCTRLLLSAIIKLCNISNCFVIDFRTDPGPTSEQVGSYPDYFHLARLLSQLNAHSAPWNIIWRLLNVGVADKTLLVKKALSKCCYEANLYKQANDCLGSSNKGLWIAGCELI